MVEELPMRYVRDANLKIPLTMQCPVPISYGRMDKYLSDAVKENSWAHDYPSEQSRQILRYFGQGGYCY